MTNVDITTSSTMIRIFLGITFLRIEIVIFENVNTNVIAKTIIADGKICVVTASDEQIPNIAIDIGLASMSGFLNVLNASVLKIFIFIPFAHAGVLITTRILPAQILNVFPYLYL